MLAAGAWSARLVDVPIRPVKGQTLRLRCRRPLLTHIVRGTVKGSRVYVVPRDNGEIVVGASSGRGRLRPAAARRRDLRAAARRPVAGAGAGRGPFIEVSTSLRPAAPDNAPIIGPSNVDGLVLAIGHYRNGILLTPITADLVAELISPRTVAAPMKLTINGEPRIVADELPLDALLHELTGSHRGSAAAVDGEVVPRSEWTTFRLRDGQSVEVLTAVQGG